MRTCWSAAEVGRRPAALILARSRTISDENFCHRCLQRCAVAVAVVLPTTTARFFAVAANEMLSILLRVARSQLRLKFSDVQSKLQKG